MNVTDSVAASSHPFFSLPLLSLSPIDRQTSEDRKNRPFPTFKIVSKLDSSASPPPPFLPWFLPHFAQQCPEKNVEVRRVQKLRPHRQRRRGMESTEEPHSLPFHSFLNPPMMRWRAHTPHGNLSFFNRYAPPHPDAFASILQG